MAYLFSLLFHPVILIQFIFIVAIQRDGFFYLGDGNTEGWIVLITALLFVTVLPIIITSLLIRYQIVLNWEMTRREERTIPFIVMIISSFLLWIVYNLTGTKGLVSQLPLFGVLLVSLVFLINFWWKISIHMAGIGGAVAFFEFFFQAPSSPILMILIVSGVAVTGLTAFARLKLKAHNPSQLVAGWIAGFLTGLFYFRILI